MENINVEKMINDLVNKGLKALDEFQNFTQEQVDYIVAKCSISALDHHGSLALDAINETKRGIFEDKATKNLFACEYVVNNFSQYAECIGVFKFRNGAAQDGKEQRSIGILFFGVESYSLFYYDASE